MDENMKLYYDYTVSPLGKLFYQTVWKQLGNIQNKKILDFGSGFGFTSNHLAKNNDVTAIELDPTMIEASEKEYHYKQIQGGLSELKDVADETFDLVICHLVLEFVSEQTQILSELIRVLKKDGTLSVVRHNRTGRIVQAIVQDYDMVEVANLLKGEPSYSSAFGNIKYYRNDDLLKWSKNKVSLAETYGVRAIASLHDAQIQQSENWLDNMFWIENVLLEREEFIKIAYFNHLLLKKI
ncbi:hypothetical protein AN639_11055 [Candidatus Epulonipiscium fishelsonii]|uniref:Uncharacterized protein n=1 Tax=Candidatus Epulonipiscium fishelsonii TaxID=77094 RepID=A0ACC8XCJ2_9FIRM|nr:hypothetical protein AN396_05880 [Epulopiscium sp. SCG-B11WGA-EpuloA1]ONI43210.1 hypothetical protein AN639_11055 [Epulopiscium sp. SCG-B05WGA-EpuloA1]